MGIKGHSPDKTKYQNRWHTKGKKKKTTIEILPTDLGSWATHAMETVKWSPRTHRRALRIRALEGKFLVSAVN